MNDNIITLRMERQFLTHKASEAEYIPLYRDMQPGQNVYWNGFGNPPSLSFRAGFNDIEFTRVRQVKRELIKGRFAGGNLGWIVPEDLEFFLHEKFIRLCMKASDVMSHGFQMSSQQLTNRKQFKKG